MLKNWDQMNQTEIKELIDTGIITLVVSSLEQHALHLPTGTDRFIGEAIMQEVAKKSKRVMLALPPIPFGFSAHHMKFPGSISVTQSGLIDLLTDIIESLKINGCKDVILFNSHGGNTPSIKVAINEMGNKFNGNLFLIEYWDFLKSHIAQIRKSPMGGIGHAGEMETSLMMYLHPELVKIPAVNSYSLAKEYKGINPDMFAGNKVYLYRDFSSISNYGNVGVSEFSSPEEGKMIFDFVTDEISSYIDTHLV